MRWSAAIRVLVSCALTGRVASAGEAEQEQALTTPLVIEGPATPEPAAAGEAPAPTEPAALLGEAPASGTLPKRRVVLTISGGVSLGSYEAGLNWALLRLIKASQDGATPRGAFAHELDLVSMTGASAGNINAFLGAVEWFSAPPVPAKIGESKPASENNLFWDAWIPIGLDQLFPGDRSCAEYHTSLGGSALDCAKSDETYRPEDGVFSRNAFNNIISTLKLRMKGQFPPSPREFPLGVTVSKVVPEKVKGTSLESLDVQTQRFAVLLVARIVGGKLVFHQPKGKYPGLVGNQLFLPSQGGKVEHDHVVDLIQASSAFPLAFGPVTLSYCLAEDLTGDDCVKPKQALFFDGGLFDNLPIGLALETLAQSNGALVPTDDYSLMYVDPEQRRNLPLENGPKQGQSPADAGHGIDYLLGLVGRFISVARSYELQSSIRFNSGIEAKPEGTSRYLPIFGGHLGAFAGFLAQPFREFDFNAGVYDALYQIASLTCEGQNPVNTQTLAKVELDKRQHERAACVLEKVPLYLKLLNLEPSSATAFVVKRALASEVLAMTNEADGSAFEHSHAQTLATLRGAQAPSLPSGSASAPNTLMVKLYDGMERVRIDHIKAGKEAGFLAVLDRIGSIDESEFGAQDACGRALFNNEDALLGDVARQLARRLVDIERAEDAGERAGAPVQPGRRVGPLVAGGAQFITENYFNGLEYDTRFRWSPSTVPAGTNWVAKALDVLAPYYGTVDTAQGGLEFGYLPTAYLVGRGSGITVPVAPFSWNRDKDAIGARAGISYVWNGRWWLFSRAEFGVYGRMHYVSEVPIWLGPEMATQILYNRLRISFNYDVATLRPGAADDPAAEKVWTIRAGLADLNGTLYWLSRAAF